MFGSRETKSTKPQGWSFWVLVLSAQTFQKKMQNWHCSLIWALETFTNFMNPSRNVQQPPLTTESILIVSKAPGATPLHLLDCRATKLSAGQQHGDGQCKGDALCRGTGQKSSALSFEPQRIHALVEGASGGSHHSGRRDLGCCWPGPKYSGKQKWVCKEAMRCIESWKLLLIKTPQTPQGNSSLS